MDASRVRRTIRRADAAALVELLRASGDAAPTTAPARRSRHAATCQPPPDRSRWGWAAQLYAVRSQQSWGMGDLADLRALGRWARGAGAGLLLVNPLNAPRPGLPQEPSPYSPSSRQFLNPLYLRIEDIPGAGREPLIRQLAAQAHRLNRDPALDRDRVYALKLRALEAIFERFAGDRRFDRFCAAEGETLERYAHFCVLAERLAGPWSGWPARFRSPTTPAVAELARRERRRVDFHRWIQWQLDSQLARASREVPMLHDLAVGFTPDGADAWMWQDVVAFGARIGAPPDEYNPTGQDWALAPFDPHRLRAAGYRPLLETLRRVLRHAAGIRIDHVMGMFRLWWIPPGARSPAEGGYVRYPAADLLDVLAGESRRSAAFVVGEDLGTVEVGVRARLRRRGVLSSRVAWFERESPSRYPTQAMAALTTHDLPTVAGVWTGADVAEMLASGRAVNRAAEAVVRRRLQRLAGVPDEAPVASVIERAYAALAEAPSRLIVATLDDAVASLRRPNLPGAVDRPNWSLPLPRTLEQLRRDALPRRLATRLTARG